MAVAVTGDEEPVVQFGALGMGVIAKTQVALVVVARHIQFESACAAVGGPVIDEAIFRLNLAEQSAEPPASIGLRLRIEHIMVDPVDHGLEHVVSTALIGFVTGVLRVLGIVLL
ncbi:hypothetical protein D3C81_1386070 [compost metagenome]